MKHNFRYFFREGAGNMLSHGFMSFAAIGVTVACLLIMGTFSLVAYNANENLKDMQKENAILAFIDEELAEKDARDLQSQVESVDGVADCSFVSREEAKESYIQQFDDNDLYSGVEASVFRHRFVIHLADQANLDKVANQVGEIEGIVKIRADREISTGFVTLRNIAGVISIALIAILLIISVFIISNTIKLTTFDRRDEIAIMKMVGATDSFIRWPFVYEGLLLGLISAGFAFGLQWVLYEAIGKGIANSDTLQLVTVSPFNGIWQLVLAAFIVVGILVGVGGSLTAIRKFLRV